MKVILDKTGRVVDGVNHGRKVTTDGEYFYKTFDKDYCRRDNFIKAYEAGFFDEVAPAFDSLIKNSNDEIVGYKMKRGTPVSRTEYQFNEDVRSTPIYQKLLELAREKKMFFYDFVPINIIITDDGSEHNHWSLIDLESVYPLDELYTIDRHNAKVKPDFYFKDLEEIWKENMKSISFIQPSRNNLKYLKWSYESIRNNLGPQHEICWADDFSDDGTWEWMQKTAKQDGNIKITRNEGPNRLGHTILYDTLVDMATNDIVMIYLADMYACPNMDTEVLKLIKPGTVVSATRIEPPLHPDGPEKILLDCGIEPEEFDEDKLFEWLEKPNVVDKPTKGIFAPWAIYKKDFLSIGGHDPLYAPQSKEDSDIFNRFVLNGYDLLQTWKGFVYHMTCRGSRFKDGALRNPAGQVFMKGRESSEWLEQNLRSTRNFIRKWGHYVKHDTHMYPEIPHKYDIGFVVKNCDYSHMKELEPWCSTLYCEYTGVIESYITHEQKNTQFDLSEKLKHDYHSEYTNDVIVSFDATKLNADNFQIIVNLSEMLNDSGDIGELEYDIFKFKIKSLDTYEQNLIKVTK